jgi:hypothetical protein
MKKNQPYKPKKFDIAVLETTKLGMTIQYDQSLQVYGHASNIKACTSSLIKNLHEEDQGYYLFSKKYPRALILMFLGTASSSSFYKPLTLYFICDHEFNEELRQEALDYILSMADYVESYEEEHKFEESELDLHY